MANGDKGAAASASAENPEGLLNRLGELAWKALPAIGSAIGFVGFVAVIGGAIEWIRFDAAGLPATQAVLAVPKQELVVVGALSLGVFVIGGVLAVLVVYLIDSDGNATPRTARGLIALGVAEMAVPLVFIGHHGAFKYVWVGLWLILILLVAGDYVGLVMRDFRRRTKVKKARTRLSKAGDELVAAEDASAAASHAVEGHATESQLEASASADGAAVAARRDFERAIEEWVKAAERVIELQEPETSEDLARLKPIRERVEAVEQLGDQSPGHVQLEADLDDADRRLGHVYGAGWEQLLKQFPVFVELLKRRAWLKRRVQWLRRHGLKLSTERLVRRSRGLVVAGAAVALGLIVAGYVVLVCDGLAWLAVLFIVVALLTAMNVFFARATDRFALYGIAVFFSVLLFGAALTFARTLHYPKVQPVALLRTDNEVGICGVYVTQTKERIYMGRLPLRGRRPGAIFWVPTSGVDLVSVGEPVSIGKDTHNKTFSNYAESLLDRLYKDRAEEVAPTLKNTQSSKVIEKPTPSKEAGHEATITKTSEHEEAPTKERSKRHPHVNIYEQSCTSTQHVDP